MTTRINLIQIIRQLINSPQRPYKLPNNLIIAICEKVKPYFAQESALLQLRSPTYICGDIHGQFHDLLQIFQHLGLPGEKSNYLFLGDYVDRGSQSIEVIMLLFLLKLKYPKKIYLIRGNHECPTVNRIYGFYTECQKKYDLKVWNAVNQVFSFLPVAALINQKIFCVHGGLSPHLKSLSQITKIKKGTRIPDQGLLCDLTWADPSNHRDEWEQNDRGVSYTFNNSVTTKFMKANGIDLICRAHQVVDKGYEFSFGKKLVTIFSAPNYCGEYGNSGSVMTIDNNLNCSFITFKPVLKPNQKVIHSDINKHVN